MDATGVSPNPSLKHMLHLNGCTPLSRSHHALYLGTLEVRNGLLSLLAINGVNRTNCCSSEQCAHGLRQAVAAQVGVGSRGVGMRQASLEEDGPQSQPPGAPQLAVAAIADEGRLAGRDPERVQRGAVNTGIRLEGTDGPGHGGRVHLVTEAKPVEHRLRMTGRVGDDREKDSFGSQVIECGKGLTVGPDGPSATCQECRRGSA
jgi:hypothetical protein